MAERSSMWQFDPVAIGRAECDAWVGYYRHEWGLVLRSAVVMVREGFAMPWPRTLLGAWYVLRANQLWAPYPDNDPDAARALMRRFYALLARDQGLSLDAGRAAELEVAWWHEHRVLQRERTDADETELVRALREAYAYVYGVPAADVEAAARARALAMRISDDWVAAGCDPQDDRLHAERRLLVESYTRLLDAVAPLAYSRRRSGSSGSSPAPRP